MRYLLVLLVAFALAPAAGAAPVADQHVTVSSDTYTPDAVDDLGTVKVDASVATSEADASRCGLKEFEKASCQEGVAGNTPRANLAAATDVGLLALLRAAERSADGPRATTTQSVTADSGFEGNAVYFVKAAAGITALGALSWLGGRVARYGILGFVPMYTYIRDGDLLKDPNRARIFDLIKAEPGISTKDVADRLGLAWGTVTHHLGKLEKRQFVVSKKYGKYRRYFANGAAADNLKKDTLAVLKVAATAEVATLVRDRPGASQKEVSEALGVSSSTILWHVKRLEKVGLVNKVRDGKLVRYYPGSTLSQDWQPMRDVVSPLA